MFNTETTEKLRSLGFEGKLLRIIESEIGSDDIESFYLFILENDGKSQLELVTKFKEQKKARLTYASFEEFEAIYTSTSNKHPALERLTCSILRHSTLNKVLAILNKMDLQKFYNFVVKNRFSYTADEMVEILEFRCSQS